MLYIPNHSAADVKALKCLLSHKTKSACTIYKDQICFKAYVLLDKLFCLFVFALKIIKHVLFAQLKH